LIALGLLFRGIVINFIADIGMYACQSHKVKRLPLPKSHNLSGRKAGVILRFSLSIAPYPHLEVKQGRDDPAKLFQVFPLLYRLFISGSFGSL